MVRTSNLQKRRGERLAEWEEERKRIRDGPNHRSVQETIKAIKSSYNEDSEVSVATTRIPLLCPITNRRISEAARGANCTHFQCFDLAAFLRMQSATPNWDCPVISCRKEISLRIIVIDDYFNGILHDTDEAVKMVELLPDGTWRPVEDERPRAPPRQLHSVVPGEDDDVQILGDTATRDGANENRAAIVPISVLYELHSKLINVFQELNSLGYKRLHGVANSLVDMNAYIKEQIAQANENSRLPQETDKAKLSQDVVQDQMYLSNNPVPTEKELSPLVVESDNILPDDVLDGEKEERHVEEQVDCGTPTKDTAWLLSQPKLNAKSKSGYILFSAEMRKRIMNENPEADFGEISRIVGVEWKKLTEEQKRQYAVRANYIADERHKTELLTPSRKVFEPGQVRVYICRWQMCDYQFDSQDGLYEHIKTSHTRQSGCKVLVDGADHYACTWTSCTKHRKDGKPFPSLSRLHRHINERHLLPASKAIFPNQRSKHFFEYIPLAQNGAAVQTSRP